MSNSQLCSVCSSLKLQRHDFETPPFEPEGRYHSLVSTGSLGHLRSNEKECPLCRLILYALHKNEGHILDEQSDETQWEMTWSQNIYEYEPETDEAQDSYGSGLYPELKIEGSNTDHCIQLVDEASTDGFLRGREIPETIDPEMIQGWMQRCMKMHGHDCIPSHLEVAPHPAATMEFMAIDVHKECLVNILPTDEYAALSYVWGQANHLTTVKSVLSEFKTPGAFNRTKPPRTIRDAMDLTRVLGFEYLWVDALCIIQDEGETKQLLISNMDAVYGHAALTLIAASGIDADAGLSGWKATSPERQTCIESMGSDWKLGVLPSFEPSLMNTPYAQRGWT